MPGVKSAEKLLHEHEVEIATNFVTYYSYDVGKGKSKVRGDNALLICHKGILFKIPRPQCPNPGSCMVEFLLLLRESMCMIAIRALTGMQLMKRQNWHLARISVTTLFKR